MNAKAKKPPRSLNVLLTSMARKAAELDALAEEFEEVGCSCNPGAGFHRSSCACLLREMCRAAAAIIRSEPKPEGKDVRHLAEPFGPSTSEPEPVCTVRAECGGCGRYARRADLIRHRPDCPVVEGSGE